MWSDTAVLGSHSADTFEIKLPITWSHAMIVSFMQVISNNWVDGVETLDT